MALDGRGLLVSEGRFPEVGGRGVGEASVGAGSARCVCTHAAPSAASCLLMTLVALALPLAHPALHNPDTHPPLSDQSTHGSLPRLPADLQASSSSACILAPHLACLRVDPSSGLPATTVSSLSPLKPQPDLHPVFSWASGRERNAACSKHLSPLRVAPGKVGYPGS